MVAAIIYTSGKNMKGTEIMSADKASGAAGSQVMSQI
jgi:hypothetical protein